MSTRSGAEATPAVPNPVVVAGVTKVKSSRDSYTVQEKHWLCQHKNQHPNATHQQLIAAFKEHSKGKVINPPMVTK
jgi:hypothetical protein